MVMAEIADVIPNLLSPVLMLLKALTRGAFQISVFVVSLDMPDFPG
jgi:hypothetical protein